MTLEERVKKLETQNNQQRSFLMILCILLLSFFSLAAFKASEIEAFVITAETIKTKNFHLIDNNGRTVQQRSVYRGQIRTLGGKGMPYQYDGRWDQYIPMDATIPEPER